MIVDEVLDWSKCGVGPVSALPTLVWAVGASWLSWRLLRVLFRRSMFRRVPFWELALQNLLFCWMVIYSMHFWVVLVRIVKLLVDYAFDETMAAFYEAEPFPCAHSKYMLQQCAVWVASAAPLAVAMRRSRPQPQPLMLWITTSPWQRRELGPHGYYLQRPAPASPPPEPEPPALRRAASDSQLARHNTGKKRHSKMQIGGHPSNGAAACGSVACAALCSTRGVDVRVTRCDSGAVHVYVYVDAYVLRRQPM